MPKNRRVAYYYDDDVGSYSYGYNHVMKPHRIKMTHSLVTAYDLLPKMDVLRPIKATAEQMTKFHTDEYIHFISNLVPEMADNPPTNPYLSGHDNPPYEGAFEFCSISAGGSICAADRLGSGSAEIAVNWAGGLHHAKKTAASGFCYINDIVLGILELLRTFPRVLYVDIDCHHGDAVEEAFYTNDRVLTCSLHKFGDFFPGTGYLDDRGVDKGYRYSINVPFRQGLCDESFHSVFGPLMDKILERFQPSVVVLQCGADSLSGDRLGQYNLSMDGHAECTRYFRKAGLPFMLLGGGGYTIKNVSRAWTYETACALGIDQELSQDLPYNQYFEWFAPEWRLKVPTSNMEDANLALASSGEGDAARYGGGKTHLEVVRERVLQFASEIPIAPSVPLQTIPSHGLAEELGLSKVAVEARSRKQLEEDDEVERQAYNPRYDAFDHRIQELAREFFTSETSSSETEEEQDWDDENQSIHSSRSRATNRIHSSNPYTTASTRHTYLPASSRGILLSSPAPFGTLGRKPEPPAVKRKFFRSEIRFKGRGEVEFDIRQSGLGSMTGLRGQRFMNGVCDPVGMDMGLGLDDDEGIAASGVEDEEGHEGGDEDEMEVDGHSD